MKQKILVFAAVLTLFVEGIVFLRGQLNSNWIVTLLDVK